MKKNQRFFVAVIFGLGLALLIKGHFLNGALGSARSVAAHEGIVALVPVTSVAVAEKSEIAPVPKWERPLAEALLSKDDNDPRLDHDFRTLSTAQKNWLKDRYHQLASEDRNQRGKIALLISRDLRTADDVSFLKSMFAESPCLSMQNCTSRNTVDAHMASVEQMSLNYPQMVVLYQVGRNLPNLFKGPLSDPVKGLLQEAAHFPVPMVSANADGLLNQISN